MRVESILPIAQQRMMTIHAHATLVHAAGLLSDTDRALLVVCDNKGVMVGVITKTDVVRQVAQRLGAVEDAKVSDVMTRPVTACRREDPLQEVLGVMKMRGFVHIPVVDQESHPCGVVNARDALQALLSEVQDEELLLRAYVMGIGYR
jgi:CBS domain-containing protein